MPLKYEDFDDICIGMEYVDTFSKICSAWKADGIKLGDSPYSGFSKWEMGNERDVLKKLVMDGIISSKSASIIECYSMSGHHSLYDFSMMIFNSVHIELSFNDKLNFIMAYALKYEPRLRNLFVLRVNKTLSKRIRGHSKSIWNEHYMPLDKTVIDVLYSFYREG